MMEHFHTLHRLIMNHGRQLELIINERYNVKKHKINVGK